MTEGSRFELNPAYFALARSLTDRLLAGFELRRRGRVVIGVAGESGSGKSITAACLARELDAAGLPTAVIHQDDYFHRPPRTNHEYRVQDLGHVGPQEVNLDLIRSHIEAFRAGSDGVTAPLVDYPANRFVTQRYDFGDRSILIVEGTYVLRLDEIGIGIFLEATHEETRERRRIRNRDLDEPVMEQILDIEHRIIAPQAERADIIIDRNFAIRQPS